MTVPYMISESSPCLFPAFPRPLLRVDTLGADLVLTMTPTPHAHASLHGACMLRLGASATAVVCWAAFATAAGIASGHY